MSGLAASPAQAATVKTAEAEGNLVSGQVVGADTDVLAKLERAYAATPEGPANASSPLDLTALSALRVDLGHGVTVPLFGDAGVVDVGAAGQYARTGSAPASAYGSSGTVGADGSIAVGSGNDPADSASVDLTQVLNKAGLSGITDGLVDQLRIELGAVASSANQEGDDKATGQYKIADGKLVLKSTAVKQLSTSLNATLGTSLGTVQSNLNALVGTNGDLNKALAGVTTVLNAALADGLKSIPLVGSLATVDKTTISASLDTSSLPHVLDDVLGKPITSADGMISLDLSAGTVSVDLAKVVKGKDGSDLNGLPANTELINSKRINSILDGVQELTNELTTKVVGIVTDAVNGLKLQVNVQSGLKATRLISGTVKLQISGTVGSFLGTDGAAAPKLTAEGTAVEVGLVQIPLGDIVRVLATPVTNIVVPAVGGVLRTTVQGQNSVIHQAFDKTLQPIVTTLSPVFDAVEHVAEVKLNVQESPGRFETTKATDAGSFTERAVQLTLLPHVDTQGAARVNLASATVRTAKDEVADPTIAADPSNGKAGDTITVSGDGYTPNSTVTVTIGGKDAGTVTTDADGKIKAGQTVTVPDGVDAGKTTLEGTDTQRKKASTEFTVDGSDSSDAQANATTDDEGTAAADGADASADVNANAAAAAGASVDADGSKNAASQAAAQAAADPDADTAASAAANADATAAAQSAAKQDASSDASQDAQQDANAASAAAVQAAAQADASDSTNANASAAANANTAAAAQAAATSDSSSDASKNAAADADGDDDKSAASAQGTADDSDNAGADTNGDDDKATADDDGAADGADDNASADVNANAAAAAGASVDADSNKNAASQAAAQAAANPDADTAASAAANADATAAAQSAAKQDASTDASKDAQKDANAASAAQAAAQADASDSTNANASAAANANTAAAAQAAATSDSSSDASKDAASDANGDDDKSSASAQGTSDDKASSDDNGGSASDGSSANASAGASVDADAGSSANGAADGTSTELHATVTHKVIQRGVGKQQTVTGTGFKPGESVKATLHSTPKSLGAAKANSRGEVTWTFEIGKDVELGSHYVAVTGDESGAVTGKNLTTQFRVEDADSAGSAGADAAAGASSNAASGGFGDSAANGGGGYGSTSLPNTGADPALPWIAATALALLLLGGALAAWRRRFRS